MSVVVWLFVRMTIVWQGLSNLQQIAACPIPCKANCPVWVRAAVSIVFWIWHRLKLMTPLTICTCTAWLTWLVRVGGIYCFVINKELSDFEKRFKLIIDHHLFCAIYKKEEISFLRLQSPVALIIVLYWKAIFINLRIKSPCFFHISIAALDLFLYYQRINYWF